jgi:3-oxoadipate enol-lactonase/4-carboxymuconolactone decarboxylase
MTVDLAHDLRGPDDAPVLVLLNSVGTNRESWSAIAATMGNHLRVLSVEARGHGRSPVAPSDSTSIADLGADVLALLDRIGLDRVDLAGVSLGGMTAMWLAAQHPHRVRSVTLVCTSALPGNPDAWHQRAAEVRRAGMDSIADAVVARWLTPQFATRHPDVVVSLRTQLCSTDVESYAQCCEVLAALDLRADLARIVAPTLVIGGQHDIALPPDPHSQVILDGIPHAQIFTVPAAHLPMAEVPDLIVGQMLDHLGIARTAASGLRTRRAVLGDEHVDAAIARTTSFTADFQDFITRYAWGEVWTRPGLARRDRSIATLAALVTLGAEHEIAMHVRAAIRNGLTPDEIGEILLTTAVYAGLPRANRAFAIAQDVLLGLEDAPQPDAGPQSESEKG